MKYAKCAFFFALMLVASCKLQDEPTEADVYKLGVTRADIVEIATKHGFQDSIAEGYKSRYFQFPQPEPQSYQYMSRESLERFFLQWKHFAESQREFAVFQKEKFNVTSMESYYALIESLPTMYADRVKSLGGPEAYQKRKQEQIATDMHIYMGEDSVLTLIPAKGDDGTYLGRRLDNKKR